MSIFLWISAAVCLSAIFCSLLLPLTIKLAHYTKAIDYPNGRRINTEPTPRLGGIAIFGGMIITLGLLLLLRLLLDYSGQSQFNTEFPIFANPDLNYGFILLALTIVFVTGVLVDLFNIRVEYKICGQILGALVAVLGGVSLAEISNPFLEGHIEFGIWSYPATVIFLVVFMNIIDIIDGVDGLAAGITTITALTLTALALLHSNNDAAILSVILIGSCLAFLRVNWYPARTFMGDSGSLLLGFALGFIALIAMVRTSAVVSLLAPAAIVLIPGVDAIKARVLRRRATSSTATISTESSTHIHNRVMKAGFFQVRIVLLLLAVTLLMSIAALALELLPQWLHIALILIVFAIIFVLIWQLELFKPVLRHQYSARATHSTHSTESTKAKQAESANSERHSQNLEQ